MMGAEVRYVSDDGREFKTLAECQEWENRPPAQQLVGLTVDQINFVLAHPESDLAGLIEDFGKEITKARLAAGFSRKGKAS